MALSLQRHQGTNLVGEMGTGKTTIAAAAAYLAGFRRVLVLCPPHLVRKWQREILATVPGAGAAIVRTISDLRRLPFLGGQPLFVVLSREQARLSYRWSPAVVERLNHCPQFGNMCMRHLPLTPPQLVGALLSLRERGEWLPRTVGRGLG